MDEKLKEFLTRINFEKDLFPVFENTKIIDACLHTQSKKFHIELEMENLIDTRIFSKLIEASKNFIMPVSYNFKLVNIPSLSLIQEYYKLFIPLVYKGETLLIPLKEIPLELVDDELVFSISFETLKDALEPLIPYLSEMFKKIGVNYKLKVVDLTNKDNNEFESLIENDEKRAIYSEPVKHIRSEEIDYRSSRNDNFIKRGYKKVAIKDIVDDDQFIEFAGKVFDYECKITRNGSRRYTIYVTDNERSVVIRTGETSSISRDTLDRAIKGTYIQVRGDMTSDKYFTEQYIRPRNIVLLDPPAKKMDNYEGEKRVELHLHTKMSNMDAVASPEDYINQAFEWGHKAIAITDHGVVQAFPDAQKAAKGKDIKIIYGLEGYVAKNKRIPVINEVHVPLEEQTYSVFDLETTGLSNRYDKIIEVGFVKYKNGQIIDRLQSFVNPLVKISQTSVELTGISDEMVLGAPTIDILLPRILDFIKDSVLVAHNGTFDLGFLNAALEVNNMSKLTNPLVETLDLSRCLFPELKKFNLGSVCAHLKVHYDTVDAHRADYDAEVLGQAYNEMIHILHNKNIDYLDELNSLSPTDSYKSEHPYHMTFLAKNEIGLKNLNKLVSLSHIKYVTSVPIIPHDEINNYREGLLIGSACFNSELFEIARNKSKEDLIEAMKFYDYIEIQPIDNYQWLVDSKNIESIDIIKRTLVDIVDAANEIGKIVVATGDCHYLNEEDKIFRDVYVVAKAVGSKFHPLNNKYCNESPAQHFRTTQEMIDGISYINNISLQKKYVIDNTNYIASLIEPLYPIKKETFAPKLDYVDADQEIRNMCVNNAHKLYGEHLPSIVEERMNKELDNIINNGYGVIYYLAYRLVKKSNDDGYLVGSRGSVGSSFVASLCGITEVNPLSPHYLCPNCKHSEFIEDKSVRSGFDLEPKVCPECGQLMYGNGQNIPFETFLGLAGNKTPDIDLNFSRDYQATAHEYTKVLCGEDNVFRAGTIGTVAEKTAFGHARGYYEAHNIEEYREADLRRLAIGCSDVKRTTGQHPAGIVVLPKEYEIYDFTAIQYPADDPTSTWKTTHYNFKSMHDELLKLDILGHLDPMAIRMLKDITGVDPESIPMNDPKVLSLFNGLEELGIQPYEAQNTIGSSGIPEFGTSFVKGVLEEAKPKKFSDLVQISGLTHGKGVWETNAQELVKSGEHTLTDVIGCRDDIMTDLIKYGMNKEDAFNTMEFVRHGYPSERPKEWEEYEKKMHEASVPQWYIDSCAKIHYMFPKAHAVAYVVMALRVAWFKVHYPLEYYAAYFSVRCDQFNIEKMIEGHDAIGECVKQLRIKLQDKNKSKLDEDLHETMELALEMTARGYKFENISIEKSLATKFVVDKEHNSLIPPFIVLPGLGEAAANSIIEARNQKMFTSKEDLLENTKITKTILAEFERLGCLDKLEDKNQLAFKFEGLD